MRDGRKEGRKGREIYNGEERKGEREGEKRRVRKGEGKMTETE